MSASPKKEAVRKSSPKKTKRELSDEELADKVVSAAASAPKKPKEEKAPEPKKDEKKPAAPSAPAPVPAPVADKKKPKPLTLDSDDEVQPAKKAAKKESKKMDEDDGYIEILSEDEADRKPKSAPKKSPQKKATQKRSPAKPSAAAASPASKKSKTTEPAAPAASTTAAPKKKFDYRKMMDSKQPPPMHGLKPIPIGEENCLFGKVFVITGTLESLEREEAARLITQLASFIFFFFFFFFFFFAFLFFSFLFLFCNSFLFQVCWRGCEERREKMYSCAGRNECWRVQVEED